MCLIPDQSVDMVLCDPPYAITGNRNRWDKILPVDLLWEQYKRIIKPTGAIVLTSVNPLTSLLVASNLEMYKYEWIWEKEQGSNFATVNHQPFRVHEQIPVFSFGKITYTPNGNYMKYNPQKTPGEPYKMKRGGRKPTQNLASGANYKLTDGEYDGMRHPRTVLKFDKEVGLHPTQKPVKLFEYLIKTYTDEGDLVLDNTVGSGTTCVASVNTNRNFLAFEWKKDSPREYYEKAVSRTQVAVRTQGTESMYGNIFQCE